MKFSISAAFVLLAFSHTASIASASPRGGFDNYNNQQCSSVSEKTVTVTVGGASVQTVTVTAAAAASTSAAATTSVAAASTSAAGSDNNNSGSNNNNNGGHKNGNNNAGSNKNNGGSRGGNNGDDKHDSKGGNNNNAGNNKSGNNGASNQNGNNGANNGSNNGAANNGTASTASNNGTASTASNNGTASTGVDNGKASNGGNNGGDLQSSLQLDPSVIGPNLAKNGLGNGTEAGQVASLTSKNNFIDFCVNKQITNGLQFADGTTSCNPVPMGNIPAKTKMIQCKFSSPPNFGTIAPNTAFDITMSINNLQTGNFVNPKTNYYAAPQQLDGQGQIIGHSHFVIQELNSITDTTALDPQKFAFFQGVNAPAQQGKLTINVAKGLPAGAYRIMSINTAANHQPALVPVAQHGSMDDAIYINVQDGGAANDKAATNGTAASTSAAATSAAATTTAAAGTAAKGSAAATGTAASSAAASSAAASSAATSKDAKGAKGAQPKAAAGDAASTTDAASAKASATGATGKGGKTRRFLTSRNA